MVISHSEKVNCSQEKLWGLLLDKAQHPERTIRQVTESKILETYPDGFLREMSAVGLNIKERITIDAKNQQIRFVLIDNEIFDGYFLNKIENKSGELVLTYTQDWKPKNPEVQDLDLQFLPVLKNAVLAMKKLAEQS
ncbi:AtaL-like protein [Candidatus Nitrosotenuis aquarius]|uniref:AtaL-like protein n=1 Tax=Candidatus Nitrosotenuis aquarius TaxID=1846278 RepID=UPI000C1EB4FB|nr:AtaL-like protein [Candidatus Nitrosotenuis aquarius]